MNFLNGCKTDFYRNLISLSAVYFCHYSKSHFNMHFKIEITGQMLDIIIIAFLKADQNTIVITNVLHI